MAKTSRESRATSRQPKPRIMPISENISPVQLVWPSNEHLASYTAALERGWSPNSLRPEVTQEERQQIQTDPAGFLGGLVDREAKGPPIPTSDGSTIPRLPGYRRWMWDGEFCGSIGLRWQHGTNTLPDFCLGHIGYSVVPWKSGKGYATEALRLLLVDAAAEGLSYVEITTSPENLASQRVIRANGGVFVEEYIKIPGWGGTPEFRFRIELDPSARSAS